MIPVSSSLPVLLRIPPFLPPREVPLCLRCSHFINATACLVKLQYFFIQKRDTHFESAYSHLIPFIRISCTSQRCISTYCILVTESLSFTLIRWCDHLLNLTFWPFSNTVRFSLCKPSHWQNNVLPGFFVTHQEASSFHAS